MNAVDVVVPCYNYARFLERCVDTILNQRGVDVRVLIIDDCSKDNSAEVAEAIVARDPRVTFWRHKENQGHIKTFNEGILCWAEAEFYTLISADDALTPGALARAVDVLNKHPDVHLAYGMALIVADEEALPPAPDAATPTYQIISGRDFLRQSCEWGTPTASPAVVIRTSEQKKLGGYCPQMIHTSDMEMWMRFATKGAIAAIRDPQAYYRWHGANMTLGYISGANTDRRERIFTCQYVYNTWGGAEISGFDQWLAAMRAGFAQEALRRAESAIEANDLKAYQECVDFAQECAPQLLRSGQAWRLRAKRALGPSLARLMRTGVETLRGKRKAGPQWFKHETELGWWPEPDELEQPAQARPLAEAQP